jgi:hypothetical protein
MVETLTSYSSLSYSNANKVLSASAYGQSGLLRQQEIIKTGNQEEIKIPNQLTGSSRKSNEDLDKTISYLSNVVDKTKLIRKLADDLTKDLQDSDRFGTGDSAAHFDITLAYLSNVAGQSTDDPNLLSSSESENYKFITSKNGQVISLNGSNLKTGYSISETTTSIGNDYTSLGLNPNIIFSDIEYGVLRHKDPLRNPFSTKLPSLPGNFVSVFKNSDLGDVQLDSIDKFDTNKVTITFFPGTISENSFTGTISREGLGILNSFLYDSFTTAAGRNRAYNDLRTAKTSIDDDLLRFEGALRAATILKSQKDLSLANYVNLIDSSTVSSAIALQEADSARIFKNNFNSILVNGLETSRNELSKMLGAVDLDGRSNRLIDLVA